MQNHLVGFNDVYFLRGMDVIVDMALSVGLCFGKGVRHLYINFDAFNFISFWTYAIQPGKHGLSIVIS